ncbi:MAG TPA: serine hydrolase domain-containing protein [Kofleriaceae bacterium]|nr:serine hydrolase domain-containing protein [Kofleriaceae bacterium]
MARRVDLLVCVSFVAAACSSHAPGPTTVAKPAYVDPDGPHRAAIAAQVAPFVDDEVVSGLVIATYDAGKREIYGFGKGPGHVAPNGRTLFEIGPVTSVYTALMFADAVQRREVTIDKPVSELLPPGVTAPTFNKHAITLGQLAVHASGLPPIPPSIATHLDKPDRFGGYGEDALYQDLVHTELRFEPGSRLIESTFGSGLLGFALGRKIGGGYAQAVTKRVLTPLHTTDTFLKVPADALARRAQGSNDDLADAPEWTWDALAGGGGMVTSAKDLLDLIEAELDAAAGSKAPLRAAMRLTQESQLDVEGANLALGWRIDGTGRYWRNGSTAGFHAFVGFDAKTKHGIVILSSTAISIVDRLATNLYKLLANEAAEPPKFPAPDELVTLAGNYDLAGTKIQIVVNGKRLYLDGGGVHQRLVPMTATEFWIEELPAIVVFERDKDSPKVARIVFAIGQQRINAPRVD